MCPFPYTFGQLVAMRRGKEYEEWDRLAYHLAHHAAFVGNKNVKLESFHKFMDKPTLTADSLKAQTRHLFPKD